MIGLTILLCGAAFGFALAKALRVPVIPVLMMCGAAITLLGELLPLAIRTDAVQLGVTFLAFAVGLELNPQRFGQQRKAVAWVGTLQMFVSGALGYAFALLLGLEFLPAVYVALAVSASSTLVVLRHLKEQHQLFEPFGRLVTGALLVQDAMMIVAIAVLSRYSAGPASVIVGVFTVVLMGVLAVLCQRYLVPRFILERDLDDETLLLAVLGLVFVFAGVAYQVGLPPLTGAFLTGFALSSFPVNGVVRGLVSSLSDFFLALFFVALGSLLTMPSLLHAVYGIALALFVLLITPPLVTYIAERQGLSARAAIESGLLLAQVGEFSLVAVIAGVELGHVPPEVVSVLALTMVITMTLTPFLATDAVTRQLLRFHPFRLDTGARSDAEGHVLLLGFGTGGMWVLRPLKASGHEILVVDDDPAVIEQLVALKIPCIKGDGSDPAILARAGVRRASLIIASMRRVDDSIKVLAIERSAPTLVRVFDQRDAERVLALGGIPIPNSVAAAETFMEWFKTSGYHGGGQAALAAEPAT